MTNSLVLPKNSWFSSLQGNLIVSCQALVSEPLFGSATMAKMALAAKLGGAVAIRANSPADIRAIRAMIDLPIFGLYKDNLPGYEVYITPTLKHAQQIYAAGADVVCIDATSRLRPENRALDQFILEIKNSTQCPVMADISTYEEGLQAEAAGADVISTTLSGYTAYSPKQEGPDFELIRRLAQDLRHPLLAEGRITTPEMAKEALNLGAYAVIVGGAITRPAEITARFVKHMNQ
jgi:N-acylglucosamine-6-phosphate 2-epimerase